MLKVRLVYSINNRTYCVYNMRTQTLMESGNVIVDDLKYFSEFSKEELTDTLMEKYSELTDEVASPSRGVQIFLQTAQTKSNKSTKNTTLIIQKKNSNHQIIISGGFRIIPTRSNNPNKQIKIFFFIYTYMIIYIICNIKYY